MRFVAFAAMMAMSVSTAQAQQYQTIVGEWYVEEYGPKDCGTPFAVRLGPMSYAEDSYVCTFDDVRRDGWQVTWNGSCSDGSTSERTRLIAVETNGRLSFNCKRVAEAVTA